MVVLNYVAPGQTGFLVLCLGTLLCFINIFTFWLFGVDKRRAEARLWRLPEFFLLRLAFLGGWLGAKAGQYYFRHKTRKQPFRSRLDRIPLWWALSALMVLNPVSGSLLATADKLRVQYSDTLLDRAKSAGDATTALITRLNLQFQQSRKQQADLAETSRNMPQGLTQRQMPIGLDRSNHPRRFGPGS